MSSKIGIFPPGSRWLYVELSASWFTLDEVVKTRWNKVVSSLRFKHLAKNVISFDTWIKGPICAFDFSYTENLMYILHTVI